MVRHLLVPSAPLFFGREFLKFLKRQISVSHSVHQLHSFEFCFQHSCQNAVVIPANHQFCNFRFVIQCTYPAEFQCSQGRECLQGEPLRVLLAYSIKPAAGGRFALQIESTKKGDLQSKSPFLVRAVGLEPTHQWYRNLNPARLPIPPCPQILHWYVV